MSTLVLLDHLLRFLQLGNDPASLPGEEQNVTVWISVLLHRHGARLKVKDVLRSSHDWW